MKRFLLHIIYITALFPLWVSCSDDSPSGTSGVDHVQLSLSMTARSLSQADKESGSAIPEDLHVWVYGEKEDGSWANLEYIHKTTENEIFISEDIHGNPIETIREWKIENGKMYKNLRVCILLNSESVTWESEGLVLGEGTSLADLENMAYTAIDQSVEDDNLLLMYGEENVQVVSHQTYYQLDMGLNRTMAKLKMYFTRRYTESDLTINHISLLPVVSKGRLVRPDESVYATTTPEFMNLFTSTGEGTTATGIVNSVLTEEDEELYGSFSQYEETHFQEFPLNTPYLFENPNGAEGWEYTEKDGVYPEDELTDTENYYQVKVEYVIDQMPKEKTFFLPPIERNCIYKIYARIVPGDKPIRFQIKVVEWSDGGEGTINTWDDAVDVEDKE